MARLLSYPLFFLFGWLFNFIVDIHFMVGFAAGWLSHTWFGALLH